MYERGEKEGGRSIDVHLRSSLLRKLAVEDKDGLAVDGINAGARLRKTRAVGVKALASGEEVRLKLFDGSDVDGAVDVSTCELVAESAIDDLVLGNL
jgi:hypothetical protein